jgi:ATP-dependent Clp protease ATP-binding subunit ClpC
LFERFSERARQVVVLAQDEARELKHDYIGTEHLLLGLAREEEGVAARILAAFDLDLEYLRRQVREIVGEGSAVPTGHLSLTPEAKQALEMALREALALGHNHIGTEHVLLGLRYEGVAARIMSDVGADAETIRNEVVAMIAGPPARVRQATAESRPRTGPARERSKAPAVVPATLVAVIAAVAVGIGLLVGWLIWA